MSDARTKVARSKAKDIRQRPLNDVSTNTHKIAKAKKVFLIQYKYNSMDDWGTWGRYKTEKAMKEAFGALTRSVDYGGDGPLGLKYRIGANPAAPQSL